MFTIIPLILWTYQVILTLVSVNPLNEQLQNHTVLFNCLKKCFKERWWCVKINLKYKEYFEIIIYKERVAIEPLPAARAEVK